jgi:hypothetical protein
MHLMPQTRDSGAYAHASWIDLSTEVLRLVNDLRGRARSRPSALQDVPWATIGAAATGAVALLALVAAPGAVGALRRKVSDWLAGEADHDRDRADDDPLEADDPSVRSVAAAP